MNQNDLQVIILRTEYDLISDLVVLSDYSQAVRLERQLVNEFGHDRVEHIRATLDELPSFFGMKIPELPQTPLEKHRTFNRVRCDTCGAEIADNWIVRHIKSGCKVASREI